MNTIRPDAVPTALNVPFTVIDLLEPFNFTTTPGSTVNVTPEETVTFPFKTYGLPANAQVVFTLYVVVPNTVAARATRGCDNDDGPNTTSSATNKQKTRNGLNSSRNDAASNARPTREPPPHKAN